jgi:hypothetical protein
MDASGEVKQPQLILSEPAGKTAESTKTPIKVNAPNLIYPALVSVLESDNDSMGAIRETNTRF